MIVPLYNKNSKNKPSERVPQVLLEERYTSSTL